MHKEYNVLFSPKVVLAWCALWEVLTSMLWVCWCVVVATLVELFINTFFSGDSTSSWNLGEEGGVLFWSFALQDWRPNGLLLIAPRLCLWFLGGKNCWSQFCLLELWSVIYKPWHIDLAWFFYETIIRGKEKT